MTESSAAGSGFVRLVPLGLALLASLSAHALLLGLFPAALITIAAGDVGPAGIRVVLVSAAVGGDASETFAEPGGSALPGEVRHRSPGQVATEDSVLVAPLPLQHPLSEPSVSVAGTTGVPPESATVSQRAITAINAPPAVISRITDEPPAPPVASALTPTGTANAAPEAPTPLVPAAAPGIKPQYRGSDPKPPTRVAPERRSPAPTDTGRTVGRKRASDSGVTVHTGNRPGTAVAGDAPGSTAGGTTDALAMVTAGGPDRPPPRYPSRARRHGLQGRVVLLVRVGAGGVVTAIQIDHSSGHRLLDRAALKAVRRWRFGTHAGPRMRIPIVFRLHR